MEEYDEPLILKLETPRELSAAFFAIGLGAAALHDEHRVKGAASLSNLQIRLATEYPKRVTDSLEGANMGGSMIGAHDGAISNDLAIAELVDHDEVDPEEVAEEMNGWL